MQKILILVLLSISPVAVQGAESPYAGEEFGAIKSLTRGEIEALKSGAGMGFAKLAELNHMPGPRHVLALSAELSLTPEQFAQTESLFERMNRDAVALGGHLLAAEQRLDHAFATGAITADTLDDALLEIGRIRARLRYVHLAAHLHQSELLTIEQIERYDRLRGYQRTEHEHEDHPGH